MPFARSPSRAREFAPFLAAMALYALMYVLNNRFQLRAAWVVPRTPLDELVSFHPGAIYLYILAYPLPAVFYAWRLRFGDALLFLRAFLTLALLSNLFFLLVPTMVVRGTPDFGAMGTLEQILFRVVLTADQPYNCLPSLHVSTVVLPSLWAWRTHPRVGLALAVMAALVAWSTLAVGQHLALDALAGTLAAAIAHALTPRGEKRNA